MSAPIEDEIRHRVEAITNSEQKAFAPEAGGNGHHDVADLERAPELPDDAWRGIFADYRALVGPTTEAPDEFHFAVCTQVLGCTIARGLHVFHAGRQYPNLFIAIIGRSGLSRKDTSMGRGNDVLQLLHTESEDDERPTFRIVTGIRSVEGLLAELEGSDKVRLIKLGELYSLMAKARQDSTGNMIPQLTEMFDCPEIINPPVLQKHIIAKRPFVSIIAGSTKSWLSKSMTSHEIYGGFANRWAYFTGTPKPPNPNPQKVDPQQLERLIQDINSIRLWMSEVPNGELAVSAQAERAFEDYYASYYYRCQVDGIIPTLLVRIQDFVWKFALLYAAMDHSPVIEEHHISPAISIGHYLEQSVIEIFTQFIQSRGKEEEMKLLEFLRGAGKPISKRDTYRALSISAKELSLIAESLVKLGLIRRIFKKNTKGLKVEHFEALTDVSNDTVDSLTV